MGPGEREPDWVEAPHVMALPAVPGGKSFTREPHSARVADHAGHQVLGEFEKVLRRHRRVLVGRTASHLGNLFPVYSGVCGVNGQT